MEGKEIPYDLRKFRRLQIAERFHWTLPEVDALSIGDLEDIEEYPVVMDAMQKAYKFLKGKK